jgi:arsenite-transporting ATPase
LKNPPYPLNHLYPCLGFKTLVVSTDPAHSLGDALDVRLQCGEVTSIVTESNLWALEIDVNNALDEFKDAIDNLDISKLSDALGVPQSIVDSLGLDGISDLLTNPPPGIDEIVALTKIFEYSDEILPNGSPRFDRIVIDTAPTGHTIRLLQLPAFLNTFTGKLFSLKNKLSGAISAFKSFMGGGTTVTENKLDEAFQKLEKFQARMARVQTTLKTADLAQFAIVTIPTSLAVAESKRLATSLLNENIKLAAIVCNQVALLTFISSK